MMHPVSAMTNCKKNCVLQFVCMTLVNDLMDGHGLNSKTHYECHPKKIKVILCLAIPFIIV